MKPEKPAWGISKQSDYGDSIWYQVQCECTDPDHCHVVEVEADLKVRDVAVIGISTLTLNTVPDTVTVVRLF